ncbi:hypothetical protein [Mesorhizobium sp. WSM2239]|uniref:Uncharacterized protein n=2 Tax=unclassified Mesorhizobium TaxID=325217 RepID=A0AAU8DKA4_9HYPH
MSGKSNRDLQRRVGNVCFQEVARLVSTADMGRNLDIHTQGRAAVVGNDFPTSTSDPFQTFASGVAKGSNRAIRDIPRVEQPDF